MSSNKIDPRSVVFDERAAQKAWEKIEKEKHERRRLEEMIDILRQANSFPPPSTKKGKKMHKFSGSSVEALERQVKTYTTALELLRSAKFKQGAVAYHPQYGNCLIQEIFLTDKNYVSNAPYSDMAVPDLSISYEIVTVGDISRTGGVVEVAESELVVYNDMTKALFDKKGA